MKRDNSCCVDCGKDIIKALHPPYTQRTAGGRAMTRAEAIFLFVDARGGRCTDCYLKKQSASTKRLMKISKP